MLTTLIQEVQKIITKRRDQPEISPDTKKGSIDKARILLMHWLSIEEEFELMRRAFDHLGESDSFQDLVAGWSQVDQALASGSAVKPIAEFETLQGWLALPAETYNKMLIYASSLYEKDQLSEASALFLLLTHLNPYHLEPWLNYGLAQEKSRAFFPAVCLYAMASLIDFEHPVPHLHSAEIYLQAGKDKMAQETFEFCLGHIAPEDKKTYKTMISDLRRQLYCKKWAHNLLGNIESAQEKLPAAV